MAKDVLKRKHHKVVAVMNYEDLCLEIKRVAHLRNFNKRSRSIYKRELFNREEQLLKTIHLLTN